jgi:DNA-binding MarR family transcriptional regulator
MSESLDAKLNEALRLYRLFEGTVQKTAAAAWLDIDVPIAQMRVLFVLSHQPEAIAVGKIGEELHIGLPAASRLVERLIQEGLVTRSDDPMDRRRTLVGLSARGQVIMKSIGGVMRSRLRVLLTQLQEDDLDAFLRGLRALEAVITQQATPG